LTKPAPSPALDRARELLNPQWRNNIHFNEHGYADLLGDYEPPVHRAIQRLMRTDVYSTIYQFGRSAVRRFSGLTSTLHADDRTRIIEALRLRPGATVVDVGCGPGNFTSLFGVAVGGGGLAVGVDASHQMLRVANTANSGPNIAYLRADAENLPFADHTAEAATCLAALYIINDPFRALDEMSRLLKPGGRIVILTSLTPGAGRNSLRSRALAGFSGLRMFERNEIVDSLRERGFVDIEQQTGRLSQTIVATKS
jgi:ubiquinone/menaquinone biosynthesis C-methylase UbiE